jgi:hypothetical protein
MLDAFSLRDDRRECDQGYSIENRVLSCVFVVENDTCVGI